MGAELAKFTAVRYDAENGAGKALAQRFGVDGFPGFVVLSPDGAVLDKFFGNYDPDELINRLRSNLQKPGPNPR